MYNDVYNITLSPALIRQLEASVLSHNDERQKCRSRQQHQKAFAQRLKIKKKSRTCITS